jgi:hypothetical protein
MSIHMPSKEEMESIKKKVQKLSQKAKSVTEGLLGTVGNSCLAMQEHLKKAPQPEEKKEEAPKPEEKKEEAPKGSIKKDS